MAVRYENQCVDCGFPCRYETCRYYKVAIPVCGECGECGEDVDKLYRLDGEELCETCVLERLEVVE